MYIYYDDWNCYPPNDCCCVPELGHAGKVQILDKIPAKLCSARRAIARSSMTKHL